MQEKVLKIISQSLDIPISSLSIDSSIENLEQWDSLNHLSLMLTIENEFGVKIPTEKMLELTSVRKVVDFLSLQKIT